MINENIKILSQIATEILNSGDIYDIDKNKSEILFPFFEDVLGYDTLSVGDIVIAPAYTNDSTYKLDYGLRSDHPGKYKTCFKVVNRGENFDDHIANIKKCLTMAETEYVVITDCFDFKFLAYDDINETLIDIGNYSLIDVESSDQSMLSLIECPKEKIPKQEYAVRDDEPEMGIEEVEEPPIIPKKKVETVKKKKKSNNKLLVFGGLILLLLIILGIVGFSTRGPDGTPFSEFPLIGQQSGIKKGQLDGTLEMSVSEDSVVSMSLYSRNIPAGGVIKFELTSGLNQDAVYGSIGADGKAYATFTIPAYWAEPQINVVAYLRFDESNYAQPSVVKSEFGEIGEKIIGKDGAPDKFAITYGVLSYNSQAVQDNLAQELLEKEKREREERLKVFGSLNIRVDSIGNWKILPADYDMNEPNITKSINVYPQIFYSAKDNLPYYYLVVGDMKGNPIMFTDVIFYADGYQWSYEVANDIKEVSVNNGVWKEWAYLDNFDFPDLIDKAKMLGSSEVSKITFKGNQIIEHKLSSDEKNQILLMISAFDTYFNTGEAPKSEWYIEYRESKDPSSTTNNNSSSENNSSLQLNYIKKPTKILERNSDAEQELTDLLTEIQNKRLTGQTVTSKDESTLELYMNRYKVLTDDLVDAMWNEIISTSGVLSEGPDLEASSGYYKLYWQYDTKSTKIESGYINEAYITPDQTIYIPVKTSILKGDKGYATFKLSTKTYNDFLKFVSLTDYEIIE